MFFLNSARVKARYGDVRSANEMRSRRDGRGMEVECIINRKLLNGGLINGEAGS